MTLGEHAQAHRRAMPEYTFHTSGPSHMPTITCTCRYADRTTTAKAGKKQESKRAAARAMLGMLSMLVSR